ncbi:hypothetical protein AS9A_2096 [Hoyosella subflava DQS3-9A1]|uniref:Uncharacterized protein n=1 Tax=Hoyosella subflava (strain DSM 45089 / JCM 17490 / NBRC 109087 / DQS3-9A1) TaxID=443218 RepID=F6EPR6_HOYSD|nr:hypothetical protein AS9A_2096 [Hoyosella subflava DQS3-9A1]
MGDREQPSLTRLPARQLRGVMYPVCVSKLIHHPAKFLS